MIFQQVCLKSATHASWVFDMCTLYSVSLFQSFVSDTWRDRDVGCLTSSRCPKFYTTRFSGQKFHTVKLGSLQHCVFSGLLCQFFASVHAKTFSLHCAVQIGTFFGWIHPVSWKGGQTWGEVNLEVMLLCHFFLKLFVCDAILYTFSNYVCRDTHLVQYNHRGWGHYLISYHAAPLIWCGCNAKCIVCLCLMDFLVHSCCWPADYAKTLIACNCSCLNWRACR